jgi:hypothetical protein
MGELHDTDLSEKPKRKMSQTGATAAATIIATAIATAASSVTAAMQSGGSKDSLRTELISYGESHYVSKESGETRAAALSERMQSGFVDVQRQLAQIQDVIRDVPKMSAQLDILQDKGRTK